MSYTKKISQETLTHTHKHRKTQKNNIKNYKNINEFHFNDDEKIKSKKKNLTKIKKNWIFLLYKNWWKKNKKNFLTFTLKRMKKKRMKKTWKKNYWDKSEKKNLLVLVLLKKKQVFFVFNFTLLFEKGLK